MFKAQDIMKTDVHVVRLGDPVRKIVTRMGQEKISGLPVIDEDGRILGVVSELDLLRAYKDDRAEEPIGNLMKTDVITVSEEAMLDEIVNLFLNSGIRRVFVDRKGYLRGVISRRDLLFTSQIRKQLNQFSTSIGA